MNDHTDGHIDTLARFLPGGKVLCMKATNRKDPNYQKLQEISRQLRGLRNAAGNSLDIIEIPSPGLIEDEDGKPMPASYMNYYISNKSVIVPTYGSSQDSAAVELIAKNFPGRMTVGLSARAILTGGGAFHCITQQEPATQTS
jgi:agmatine deiminase